MEDVSVSEENSNVIWKIGDANRTLDGAHVYDLTYRVENAVGRFGEFDEIYWNVTGEGWDTSLPVVTASVSLPEGVEATQSRCYVGAYGSTAEDCSISENGSILEFSSIRPNESMTVAVGFPKGVMTALPLWKRLLWAIIQYGPWALPLLVFAFAYRFWKKQGDDAPLGAIVTRYEPSTGLTPAETRALLTQSANAEDITCTIVDLASRGYLIIEKTEKKGLLRATKEYTLVSAKDFRTDISLRVFELCLLASLFTGVVGEKVELSSLKKTFHVQVQASPRA